MADKTTAPKGKIEERLGGSKWFSVPNWALEGGARLTPYERLVLVYLARRAGNDGQSWPSVELVASDLGMSQASVRRAIFGRETGKGGGRQGGLVDKGLVAVEHRFHEATGMQTSSLYRVNWEAFPSGASGPSPQEAPPFPTGTPALPVGNPRPSCGEGEVRPSEQDPVKGDSVKQTQDEGRSISPLCKKTARAREASPATSPAELPSGQCQAPPAAQLLAVPAPAPAPCHPSPAALRESAASRGDTQSPQAPPRQPAPVVASSRCVGGAFIEAFGYRPQPALEGRIQVAVDRYGEGQVLEVLASLNGGRSGGWAEVERRLRAGQACKPRQAVAAEARA